MTLRRRTHPEPTALTPDVVNVLLLGWGGAWTLECLNVYQLDHEALYRIWVGHKATLRAEAHRRGLDRIWVEVAWRPGER